MISKTFDANILIWRKWKVEMTKHFDDELEGMKKVIGATARLDNPVTKDVLDME